jgi:nitrous oxidase accessory protein NosD
LKQILNSLSSRNLNYLLSLTCIALIAVSFGKVEAQSTCVNNLWEPNFSNPGITLCDFFPNFQPDPGYAFSGTTLSSSLPTQLVVGKKIRIDGEFIVNTNDFQMLGCTLKMGSGSIIRVQANKNLKIQGSKLFSCEMMWQGINIETSGGIEFTYNQIEDAQFAVRSGSSCSIEVNGNNFNRNWIGLDLGLTGLSSNNCLFQFSNNWFRCSSALRPPYPNQDPSPGPVSMAGIVMVGGTFIDISTSNFDTQRYGIITLGTFGSINSCRFTHMVNSPSPTGLSPGIGIWAVWNSDLNIVGEGNTPNSPLAFSDCQNACVTANGSNISVSSCRANLIGERAIHTTNMKNNRALVFNNRMESPTTNNTGYVFEMDRSANLSDEVHNNIMEFINTVGGIRYSGFSGAGANTSIVSQNILNLTANWSIGMDMHNVSRVHVTDNIISMNNGELGLHLFNANGENENEMSVRIVGNTIIAPLTKVDFHLEDSGHTRFCDNHFIQGVDGLRVTGVCAGTGLYANEFNTQTTAGLHYLSNATTGAQSHRGNYWVGTSPSQSSAKHDGNNFTDSPYFVNSSLSTPVSGGTYLPSNNHVGWFIDQNSSLNACPPFAFTSNPIGIDDFDINIANGEYETQVQSELDVWMAKRMLYQKLAENPSLRTSTSLMASFWQIHEQASIGKFYAVEKAIREIVAPSKTLADSLLLTTQAANQTRANLLIVLEGLKTNPSSQSLLSQKYNLFTQLSLLQNKSAAWKQQINSLGAAKIPTAQTLNASISTTKVFELNEQFVNSVLLEHLASGDSTISATRQATVRPIATQCPQVGGPAVGRAQVLLPACEQFNLHQLNGVCSEPRSVSRVTTLGLSCSVSPNPAHGAIEFSLSQSKSAEIYLLKVFDLSGKEVCRASFYESSYLLDTHSLPPGIYFYHIKPSEGQTFTGKFVISH